MSKEIEIKLKLGEDFDISIFDIKFIKEVHVLDIYFDNNLLNFRGQDKVLRLRGENNESFIAYKGPREEHNDFIVREEIEPKISSFEEGLNLVKSLGFFETAKVEKVRSYFNSNEFSTLSITMDKYPFIGNYLEVEGNEDEVYSFIKKYNLNLNDSVKKNCSESFLEYCDKNNLTFENSLIHFTFEDEKSLKN